MLWLIWGIVAFAHSEETEDSCTFNKRIRKHRSCKVSQHVMGVPIGILAASYVAFSMPALQTCG